ncbi:hypothetical protein [Bacteroides sp. UBA939]|uniref:hypothetical protein n=1 Tax=Bacteroides sp. UBA939 TaxID=1946092 RepID=UPI0025BBDE12|nr:hypothetical protein [Bacteroides sp. UBA939]
MERIIFDKKDRRYWIKSVNSIIRLLKPNNSGIKQEIKIHIPNTIKKNDFTPFHIVLLSCLIEYIERYNYIVYFEADDLELINFVFSEVEMHRYINNTNTAYVKEKDTSNLNLWKIVNNRAKEYSIVITEYLQRTYFKGLDISGFQNSLDEIYANVADHSKSNGIAFSYINYDEEEGKIHFAACDLGLGIPTTLRAAMPEIKSDELALKSSLDIGVSAKTNKHNRGFGLDNVLSNLKNGGMMRVVSNKALLFCQENKNNIRTYTLDFDFKGTLIYFDISIDSFEKDEEIEGDVCL